MLFRLLYVQHLNVLGHIAYELYSVANCMQSYLRSYDNIRILYAVISEVV